MAKFVEGFDVFELGNEQWTVTRRLLPGHPTTEFGMVITKANFQRLTRGPSRGRCRMTIVVEYLDKEE